jgi:sialate O-acetylesterase
MYNSMILPYAPMAVSGCLWYQGEADTASAASARNYSCLFPAMITAWRK